MACRQWPQEEPYLQVERGLVCAIDQVAPDKQRVPSLCVVTYAVTMLVNAVGALHNVSERTVSLSTQAHMHAQRRKPGFQNHHASRGLGEFIGALTWHMWAKCG